MATNSDYTESVTTTPTVILMKRDIKRDPYSDFPRRHIQ